MPKYTPKFSVWPIVALAAVLLLCGTAVMAASHPTPPPAPEPIEEYYPFGGPIPDCEPLCDSEDVDAVDEDEDEGKGEGPAA